MASRYNAAPRDRSPPPRHFDRRPSATYSTGASTYRGTGDPQASSLDRPPPRGPKADFRGGGYSFGSASRGRGAFPSRAGDTWDRDRERERDTRGQAPAYRRDDERGEWPRRERDFPPSDRGAAFPRERTYVGRDRSASPERSRRNSKEAITPTFSRPTESASSYYAPATRGAPVRGRGRGDWERSRGRPSFVADRDRDFFPRSRSREEWRERDFERGRPPAPDGDRGERFDRREYDRPDDREGRGREHDVWPRDRSPGRNSTGRPVSPSALSTVSQHAERYKTDYDAGRKPTIAGPPSARVENRREADPEYFSSRNEAPRREGLLSQPFPAPIIPPSASLGLDYGPPPSVPAAPPPIQDKPPPPKSAPTKPDPPPVSSTSTTPSTLGAPLVSTASMTPAVTAVPTAPAALQPPSGPKADRIGPPPNAPSTPRSANLPFEPWPKTESGSRSLRPGSVTTTPSSVHDSNWKPGEPTIENRITPSAIDRPLPVNVPSGPRAISGSFRGRLLSNEQVSPSVPPTAPRQPKANNPENRPVPNAPTGPRASTFSSPTATHSIPPTGPLAGNNRQWMAPDYRPSKPSIMNQMNKPYQSDVRERSSLSGPSPRPGGVVYQIQQAKPKITQPLSAEATSQKSPAKTSATTTNGPPGGEDLIDEDMPDSPADVEMSLPASDEEDVEDDDGLDEDYFASSEETHLREMKLLESKKPPPPFLDPTTASLIVRIQLLGMLASDIIPEAYESVKATAESAMDLDHIPVDAPPSPEQTPEANARLNVEHPKPRGRPLSQQIINPIPTPPIDELPYFREAINDCHVFEESEDDVERESTAMLLCQTFEYDAQEEMDKMDDLHSFFESKYPLWRRDVEQAEQRLREVHQPSPAPASPAPSATPSLPAALSGIERTRGARNTTDLDMQQAILMSQQSAKEEEERREREAASNATPNYETEALVPYMVRPSETELGQFEDTNKKVNTKFALDIYGFVPPEDDFTDEEQAAFISAYCQNPKKWGKIADAISARTYQDCIMHYYLTKDKANYKEHWRRSQPKRGRRRAANVKPRANNLMSDLALNEDGEGTPAAVTDSGRPRRAAAPTFGDMPDSDAPSAAPQTKRLKDPVKDADPNQPKPRGRKGTGTGKGRKTKDKMLMMDLASQPLLVAGNMDVLPQKLDRIIPGKDKVSRLPLKPETSQPKFETRPTATALTSQMPLDVSKISSDVSHGGMGPAPVQVTSYWSVPEQQKFKDLVQHFGRDFAGIANFLKTKSAIMIKNYYQREVSKENSELDKLANLADERRAMGHSPGPPPTPVQPPKRRYVDMPSTAAIQRGTTGLVDQHMNDIDAKPAILKNIVDGESIANPRPPKEIVHQVYPKTEEQPRLSQPSLLQRPSQGPPRGKFQDESSYAPQHAKIQAAMQEASPHIRPLQTLEHLPVDVRPPRSQHIETRGPDLGRSLLPHREQTMQPQQISNITQYPPSTDRPTPQSSRVNHSRHPSLLSAQNSHEHIAMDSSALRNIEVSRSMAYSTSAAQSPIPVVVQAVHQPNADPYAALRSAPAGAESSRPAPIKRSNVHDFLNNDPPEQPPAKKPSLEASKAGSVNTPPSQPVAVQPSYVSSRQQEDSIRNQQLPYGRGSHMESIRLDPMKQEHRQDYAGPAAGRQNDRWLDRFDKRQPAEQRPAQPSPVPGGYSVIPPKTQSTPTPNVSAPRYDPARNLESNNHHRAMLGVGHAPSPPPQQQHQQQQQQQQQQQHQSSHLHRTSSGSSHHGRGQSMVYQQTSTAGSLNYPLSTSGTPVSGLHQRNQPSIDNHQRSTIQQYMREQRRDEPILHHQTQPSPTSQTQITQQSTSQQSSRLPDRRDVYGTTSETRSGQAHHILPPTSQTPQPQQVSMGYSNALPARTYTPPQPSYGSNAGHPHGHHPHQQQQQQQQQYQIHQSQYSHGTSQAPNHHHQVYQNHPGYGVPPPQQLSQHSRSNHPMGNAQNNQQTHYRNYSTDERR